MKMRTGKPIINGLIQILFKKRLHWNLMWNKQIPIKLSLWKKVKLLSRVWLFATPWTVAHQAPLSMGILQARILEWVAIPSSRGSSWPRDQTLVSCISCTAGRLFTFWATGEVLPVLFGEPWIIVTCKISVLQQPIFSPWEWYRPRYLLYIWP